MVNGYKLMGNITGHIRSIAYSPKPLDHLSFQPDTIPKPQSKDTLDTKHEGINPLFLLIERKTQEVEAIKEQAEKPAAPVVRRPTIPKVDTTCYICREGEHQSLHAIVDQGTVMSSQPFVEHMLYDASYYNSHVHTNQQVFIETIPGKPTNGIHIKPIEQADASYGWLFFPMMVVLIITVFIKFYFSKHINGLFKGAVFFHIGKKTLQENTITLNRFFRMLDTVLLVSLPIAAIQAIIITDSENFTPKQFPVFALYVSFGFLVYRAFRFISNRSIGFISNQRQAMVTLHINQLIYERIFALLLIPLNLLMLYSSADAKAVFLFLSFGVFGFSVVLRLFRTAQVFLFNGFSMFYLFLYLCALEIIPILIVINEFF